MLPDWVKDTKPVYDYSEIKNTPIIPTKTSDLTNDSGFITLTDIPEEVIYVDEFPSTNLTEHAIYVNKDKQVKIRVNGEWLDLSVEVINELSTSSTNTQIANAKTVYDFVVNKIAEASNTYANKTDIPTKTSDLINDSDFITAEVVQDFITLSDIPEEVIYVEEFPETGVNQAIYVDAENEVKIWVNNQWLNLSAEISSVINENSTNTTVPDSKTVYDFVVNKITEANNNYANKTDIPTKTSDLTNDSGFITANNIPAETDPIYTADKANLALKTDLTNMVKLEYITTTGTPYFSSNKFIDFSSNAIISLNLSLTAGLKNAAILFLTGDTITYTITNQDNYKVNKAFEFEPNSYYLMAIDGKVVLWTKVEEYA